MRRSSNAGSCNCTRTASPRARSGRSATSRVPPCTGGCGGPQQRFDQGGRQPHAGAERADRVEGAQPPVGDGGGCFRTSGAGIRTKAEAIRSDAGRCPVSAQYRILGVAKSTYCWMLGHPEAERVDPPMRVTRSACGATAARSMGQEDQARPGACGHRHVAPPRQPDHEGRGHGGLVFEGPVPAASGQAERRSGPRTSSAANSMATPPHTHIAADPAYVGGSAVHGRAYACPASSRTARSRATPSGRGATRISCWPRSPRCASRWAASRCSTPTGAASSPGNASNECSTCSASRVSCRIPAAPTTTRWSNPPTVSSEGARIRQHVHERGTTALGRQPVRMVVQPPAAPLDPRIHEPRGVHTTRCI